MKGEMEIKKQKKKKKHSLEFDASHERRIGRCSRLRKKNDKGSYTIWKRVVVYVSCVR